MVKVREASLIFYVFILVKSNCVWRKSLTSTNQWMERRGVFTIMLENWYYCLRVENDLILKINIIHYYMNKTIIKFQIYRYIFLKTQNLAGYFSHALAADNNAATQLLCCYGLKPYILPQRLAVAASSSEAVEFFSKLIF